MAIVSAKIHFFLIGGYELHTSNHACGNRKYIISCCPRTHFPMFLSSAIDVPGNDGCMAVVGTPTKIYDLHFTVKVE